MMEALTKLVISTYKHLYQDEKYNLEVIKDNERIIKFKNQTIHLDNFVATRYRLTFSDYEGVIDDFRDQFDEIYGFVYYCCDVSNFIDLTETFIKQINDYYERL